MSTGLAARLLDEQPELLDEIVEQHLINKRRAEASKFKEPADANIIENPNLHKRIAFPKMVYHHGDRQHKIVHSEAEHKALGPEWQEKPYPAEAPKAEPELKDRLASVEQQNAELQATLLGLAKQNAELQEAVSKLLEKKSK